MLLCSLSFSHKHKCTPTHYPFVSLSLSAPLSVFLSLLVFSTTVPHVSAIVSCSEYCNKDFGISDIIFLYVRRTGRRHPKKVTHKIT